MPSIYLIFVSVLLASVVGLRLADIQSSVYIKGSLSCGGKPVTRANITIINGYETMGAGTPQETGEFQFSGVSEDPTPDPQVKIEHECDDRQASGTPKLKFWIGKQFICPGVDCMKDSNRTYEVSTIQVNSPFRKPPTEAALQKIRRYA